MKNSQLQKVLRLIRTNHDRVVVLDPTNDDVVVMLPLEDYENLQGTGKSTPPNLPPDSLVLPEELESVDDDEAAPMPLDPAEEEQAPIPTPRSKQSWEIPASRLEFSADWPASNASRSDAGWSAHNATSQSEELNNLPEEPEEQFYPEPI